MWCIIAFPNMPGIVARTATHGFVNVATPYILQIANLGVEKAMAENPAIEMAVNTYHGEIRHLTRWNLGRAFRKRHLSRWIYLTNSW